LSCTEGDAANCGDLALTHTLIAGNGSGSDLTGLSLFRADHSLIQRPGDVTVIDTIGGTNLLGVDPLLAPLADNGGATLTHGLLPGSPAIDHGDPNFSAPPEFDQRGKGFARVSNTRIDLGAYEVQAQEVEPPTLWLRALDDMTGDGTPELALIGPHGSGGNLVSVRNADRGDLVSQFSFSGTDRPVAVALAPSPDATTGPSLVLLTAAGAQMRAARGGALQAQVAFAANGQPVDLTVLPGRDGSAAPRLALLAAGPNEVEVRAAVSGEWLNTLSFGARFEPRQVFALPERNGSAAVGVVLSEVGKTDRVVIADPDTGATLRTLWAGGDLLQAAAVADRNGNGAPEVALLWRNRTVSGTHLWVIDSASTERLAALAGFNSDFTPLKFVAVSDLSGDGVEEYAVLGRQPLTGQVTVSISNGATGTWVNRLWYNRDCVPLDLASLPDSNGNGAPELALLGRCGPAGSPRVFIKDARSGALLKRIDY